MESYFTKDRVVVPLSLRPRVLNKLHSAHQGVTSMHACAQQMVFWPGITQDTESIREKLQLKLSFSTIVTTRVIGSSYKSFQEDICRFFPVCWKQFYRSRRQIVRLDRYIFNTEENISSRFAWFD